MLSNKKFVKALIVILVLSMIVFPLISAVVSADEGNMIVFDFLEETDDILEPKIFYNKDITIVGNALENTKITVNKLWYKPAKERSIISKEKSWEWDYSDGEWIFQNRLKHTVGASSIFAIPVKINIGKYKIEVIAKNGDGVISKEIEIEYKDKDEINEEFRSKIFGDLNLDIE